VLPRANLGRRLAAASCVAAVGVGLLAACSSGSKHNVAVPNTTPSATPTPTPSPTPALVATLNGLRPAKGPIVVIKVDNSTSARPLQKGFAHAPVVYQEIIEGEATRFAAVFVGGGSPEVGPIRSARDTDIELFAEYGPIVFGFSGANVHVLQHVDASPLIGVPQERYGSAYTWRGRRAEANNYYTSSSRLINASKHRHHAVGVRDVGFRFGPALAAGQAVRGTVTVRFNGASYVTFRYNAARHGFVLTQNGRTMSLADGAVVAPQNVIVQFVPVVRGKYHDVLGNNSPDTHSIGTGRAVVFRDGRRYDGRWRRPSRSAGTHFLTTAGTDIPLRPGGQTWVLLVPTNGRITGS
jgi:hypothetical protein